MALRSALKGSKMKKGRRSSHNLPFLPLQEKAALLVTMLQQR
jgi:hypothetical protein